MACFNGRTPGRRMPRGDVGQPSGRRLMTPGTPECVRFFYDEFHRVASSIAFRTQLLCCLDFLPPIVAAHADRGTDLLPVHAHVLHRLEVEVVAVGVVGAPARPGGLPKQTRPRVKGSLVKQPSTTKPVRFPYPSIVPGQFKSTTSFNHASCSRDEYICVQLSGVRRSACKRRGRHSATLSTLSATPTSKR